jgi:hypothetical protein
LGVNVMGRGSARSPMEARAEAVRQGLVAYQTSSKHKSEGDSGAPSSPVIGAALQISR